MANKKKVFRKFEIKVTEDLGKTWRPYSLVRGCYYENMTDDEIVKRIMGKYARMENEKTVVIVIRVE